MSSFETIQQQENLGKSVKSAHQRIEDIIEQLREERELRQKQEQRITELETKVRELDERTDLLSLLNQQQALDGGKAQSALVQHLYQKAKKREKMGKRPTAKIDKEAAEEALHHPDVDRTTVYQWMRRAAERVEGKTLQYDGGELRLNLQASGDLPTEFVTGGEV